MTQSGGGAENTFFSVTLQNFQKSGEGLKPPPCPSPSVGPVLNVVLKIAKDNPSGELGQAVLVHLIVSLSRQYCLSVKLILTSQLVWTDNAHKYCLHRNKL